MAGPTWENPIKTFFRPFDVDSMKDQGIDLSNYDDVKKWAGDIYSRVSDGSMPCDGPWPPEKVTTFKQWLDAGTPKS